jgi:hypothetical protein
MREQRLVGACGLSNVAGVQGFARAARPRRLSGDTIADLLCLHFTRITTFSTGHPYAYLTFLLLQALVVKKIRYNIFSNGIYYA